MVEEYRLEQIVEEVIKITLHSCGKFVTNSDNIGEL
jgi:hypothetical protein